MPSESQHHFLVLIPRKQDEEVYIYERFHWQDDEENQSIDLLNDRPKVGLTKLKWKIEDTLRLEFNERLKKKIFWWASGILVRCHNVLWEKKWFFWPGH